MLGLGLLAGALIAQQIARPIRRLGTAARRVASGDLVVADDTGVCFIPRDNILEVLEWCEKKTKAEDTRVDAIARGVPVPDFYGPKDK